jgi:hypothetical protein
MVPVEYLIHEMYAEKSASVLTLKCAKESSANRQRFELFEVSTILS